MDQIAATIGNFDGVHIGHRRLVELFCQEARVRNLHPVVFTFDVHPISVIMPHRPYLLISTPQEKLQLFEDMGIRCIFLHFDREMAAMDARTFMEDVLLRQYGVRYLLIGYDHRFGHNRTEGYEDYEQIGREIGIELARGPKVSSGGLAVSSSRIRKLLANAEIEEANHLLGHHYTLSGRVVGGKQVGRTIGYPTANIHISDAHKLLPPHGVYGVRATSNEGIYDGMLYIGNRPSLNNGSNVSIEVNIFDMKANMYNQEIKLELIFFEREDCKFDSIEALRKQIATDESSIRARLKQYHTNHPTR